MKKYFDMVGKKFGTTREKMRNYWARMMNDSTHIKISEGAREADRLMTSAHKDQWRKNSGGKK